MINNKDGVLDIVNYIISKNPSIVNEIINLRRVKLSGMVSEYHKSTVVYGPFKGLVLSSMNWGIADKGAMILGLYEKEILHELECIGQKFDCFIDIGAADGYYGLGVIKNGLFKKSYCFEMTYEGRESIRINSLANGLVNKIVIKEAAKQGFYNEIELSDLKSSLLFIDIEGGEFDLLSEDVFQVFRNSPIIIELHDWFFKDSDLKMKKLIEISSKTHNWREIKTGGRDLSKFPELNGLNDNDRWILCSEGRARAMKWAHLNPISKE